MLGEFIDNLDGRKSIIEIIYNYQEENNVINEKNMKMLKSYITKKQQLIKEITGLYR